MKLGIIGGAGLLGSTTAFCVGLKDVLEEIKLVDMKENIVKSHAMDMGQALKPISRTLVSAADFNDIGDCDIILITASLPERSVANRNEYLAGNLSVITPICQKIKENCNNSIVINATNPVDVFNYVVWKLLGWEKNKIIGFSANDSLRFKWAIEMVTGREFQKLDGMCVGEHGDGQIRLYDQLKYEGKPLYLSAAEKNAVEEKTANWFTEYQALKSGRTSGWTSAVSLSSIIEAIATDRKSIIPCSTIIDSSQYDISVSMGMPVRIGKNGVEEIVSVNYSDEQKQQMHDVAQKIRGLIDSIEF